MLEDVVDSVAAVVSADEVDVDVLDDDPQAARPAHMAAVNAIAATFLFIFLPP
jgi:hypothetical protein